MTLHGEEFACLYTKHKTQKRKTWHDGRLSIRGAVARLYEADPPPGSSNPCLDTCEVPSSQQLGPGQLLEMEHFLVTVEGSWAGRPVPNTGATTATAETTAPAGAPLTNNKTLPKFRKPPTRIPPPIPPQKPVGNRKRPLQPGELHQQHYSNTPLAPPGFINPQQPNGFNPPQGYVNLHGESCSRGSPNYPSGNEPRHYPWNFDPLEPTASPDPSVALASRQCPPTGMPPTTDPPIAQSNPPRDGNTKMRCSGLFYSGNGFDPSRFYGEDDREEEEEDDGDNDDDETNNPETLPVWRRPSGYQSRQPDSRRPSGAVVAPVLVQNDHRGQETLSEQQLLDLFGVATSPRVPAAAATENPRTVPARESHPSSAGIASHVSAPSAPSKFEAGEFTLPSSQSSDDSSQNVFTF